MVEIFPLFGIQRPHPLLAQHLDKADDAGERRAQLVGDVMHKIVAQGLSFDKGGIAVGQGAFHLNRGADIREGDERGTIRQGRQCAVQHFAIGAGHAPLEPDPRLGKAGDGTAQLGPYIGVGQQHGTGAGKGVHMWAGVELGKIQPP